MSAAPRTWPWARSCPSSCSVVSSGLSRVWILCYDTSATYYPWPSPPSRLGRCSLEVGACTSRLFTKASSPPSSGSSSSWPSPYSSSSSRRVEKGERKKEIESEESFTSRLCFFLFCGFCARHGLMSRGRVYYYYKLSFIVFIELTLIDGFFTDSKKRIRLKGVDERRSLLRKNYWFCFTFLRFAAWKFCFFCCWGDWRFGLFYCCENIVIVLIFNIITWNRNLVEYLMWNLSIKICMIMQIIIVFLCWIFK